MELDVASSQIIKLDIPGGDYFLTTFEEHDAKALQEVLAIDSVSDRLIRIPKPWVDDHVEFSSSKITIAKFNAKHQADILLKMPISGY